MPLGSLHTAKTVLRHRKRDNPVAYSDSQNVHISSKQWNLVMFNSGLTNHPRFSLKQYIFFTILCAFARTNQSHAQKVSHVSSKPLLRIRCTCSILIMTAATVCLQMPERNNVHCAANNREMSLKMAATQMRKNENTQDKVNTPNLQEEEQAHSPSCWNV